MGILCKKAHLKPEQAKSLKPLKPVFQAISKFLKSLPPGISDTEFALDQVSDEYQKYIWQLAVLSKLNLLESAFEVWSNLPELQKHFHINRKMVQMKVQIRYSVEAMRAAAAAEGL